LNLLIRQCRQNSFSPAGFENQSIRTHSTVSILMHDQPSTPPHTPRDVRPWLGVVADVFLTVVLLILGFDPAFEVVTRYRHESALALGFLHIIMVPSAMLTAMIRSDKLKLFAEKPGFLQQATGMVFLLFYIFGWLLPILVFAQRTNVPSWMIWGCICAHIAPIVATVVLAIFKRAHWMDRLAEWIAQHWGPQAIIYGAYLAGIEVFLMLARAEHRSFGPLPLLIWAGAYLPTRLLLAKITGLQGPERWTFLAANIHLLVRLLITHPD
jgi:hypothetical protein